MTLDRSLINTRFLVQIILGAIGLLLLGLPRFAMAQASLPVQWMYSPINYGAAVAYSPDGSMIAIGGTSGVQIYAASTGTLQTTLPTAATYGVFSLAFSVDSKTLAVGGTSELELWTVATSKLSKSLATSLNHVNSLAFSSDGVTLAAGGDSSTAIGVELWNLPTDKVTETINSGVGNEVYATTFSPNGATLAFTITNPSNSTSQVELWSIANGSEEFAVNSVNSVVWTVAFSPNGQTVADGGASTNSSNVSTGKVEFWNASTGASDGSIIAGQGEAEAIAYSPDGSMLAVGGGSLELWNTSTNTMTGILTSSASSIVSIQFSPNGSSLAVLGSSPLSGIFEVWNVAKSTLT